LLTSQELKILLYLQTFYGQILMYLIIHPCFYLCIIDVQQLPQDDQDRLKHVRVLTNCL